jgi:hypothetical protein
LAAEAGDYAGADERDEIDLAVDPGLEAHRGSRWHVQAITTRCCAIKLQSLVGLSKVKVRTNLNRPVAGVHDRQRQNFAPSVQLKRTIANDHLTGNH